jgi:protein-S-isoprenylcysteine O-methyltransferase Ste14
MTVIAARSYAPKWPLVIDGLERVWALGFFATFAVQWLHPWPDAQHASTWLLVASEALLVFFIMVRRPSRDVTSRPVDWALAFAATSAPLLARPAGGEGLVSPQIATVLVMAGLLLQISAKLILRRSFGLVAANRGIKMAGPYRLVRHPMYLGYVTTHVGILLINPSLWNFAVYGGALLLQIARINAEERLLVRDPHYAMFVRKVRYRLVPGVW